MTLACGEALGNAVDHTCARVCLLPSRPTTTGSRWTWRTAARASAWCRRGAARDGPRCRARTWHSSDAPSHRRRVDCAQALGEGDRGAAGEARACAREDRRRERRRRRVDARRTRRQSRTSPEAPYCCNSHQNRAPPETNHRRREPLCCNGAKMGFPATREKPTQKKGTRSERVPVLSGGEARIRNRGKGVCGGPCLTTWPLRHMKRPICTGRKCMERATGFEPATSTWQGGALPTALSPRRRG